MTLDAEAKRYHEATYVVRAPDGTVRVRLMEQNGELDALLESAGVGTWAMMTAWNPGSTPLPPVENARAAAELVERLQTSGHVALSAEMIPDDDPTAREEWAFVMGMTAAAARELGRRYRQTAVLFGVVGGVPLAVRSLE